jgi:hypothetical protein
LCCVIAALGYRRARREALVADGAVVESSADAGREEVPSFAFPWVPAGSAPALRSQLLATLAGAAVAATVAGVVAGVVVAVALLVAFRLPRARAFLALAPVLLVGVVGLYVAGKQVRHAMPPVFEWPTLFSRATTPAWIAIVLFGADAFYEAVRRGRHDKIEEQDSMRKRRRQ